MTIQVVTAAAYQPVTLAEARAWCRIEDDVTENDGVITQLLKTMTAFAENLTGRAFIERTLRLYLPAWPVVCTSAYRGTAIVLPQPPLVAVDSITYLDEDGVEQTLGTTLYDVHSWREPALVVPAWDETWPSHRGVPDAIRVNYRAGYPAVGSPQDEAAHQAGQPAQLKVWIQARLATLFEMREQIVVGSTVNALPHAYVDGLLDDLVIGERIGA